MTYPAWLPSKKFLITLTVLGIIVAGYFIVPSIIENNRPAEITELEADQITVRVGDFVGRDTDGDGLEDWEEILLGFNPTNSDTDGDGENDGVEARATRTELQANNEDFSLIPEELGPSDIFARQLFTSLAILESQGTLDARSQQQLQETIGAQVVQPLIAEPIRIVDIQIVEPSPETYENYAVSFADNVPAILSNETQLFNFLATIDAGGVVSTNVYNELVASLRAIRNLAVPSSVGIEHLAFLNNLNELTQATYNLSNEEETDPLVYFQSVLVFQDRYERGAQSLDTLIQTLRTVVAAEAGIDI
jgi:hypothetical protein